MHLTSKKSMRYIASHIFSILLAALIIMSDLFIFASPAYAQTNAVNELVNVTDDMESSAVNSIIDSATSTSTSTGTTASDWPTAPDVTAESAILIDADTGAILFEKNAHEKAYPASTTKILTGLLTIENANMNDTITFSSAAVNSINPYEDANLGIKTGEQLSVEDALYGLLLYSANEIAYGLAEYVSGNASDFVDLMNKKAAELGATDTHFANPSGLYDANHYTTAYDLAMIAKGCYNNSTFVNIDSTYTNYTIAETNMSSARTFQHRHKMLKGRAYYYEYCKGGKTGFTDESGYTLVTFAEKDGMRLIAVVFKEPDDATRFVETKTLFEWGFANFTKLTATTSDMSSIFSNDNYYSSSVFGNLKLNFNVNAAYVTVPVKASANVTMDLDETYDVTSSGNSLTARLKFLYDDRKVGTTKLTISSGDAFVNGLPFLSSSSSDSKKSSSKAGSFTLDVRIVIVGIIAIFILWCAIESGLKAKKRKRRVRRYRR